MQSKLEEEAKDALLALVCMPCDLCGDPIVSEPHELGKFKVCSYCTVRPSPQRWSSLYGGNRGQ